MKKKALALVLCLAMVLSVLPMSVFAAENESISYIDRSWDGEKVVETEKECADYIVVDANTTAFVDGNWYVVNGEVTISSRIVVSGTANLILCDDCTLNANSGIQLFEGNALNIYGQSADSGKLNAKASYLGNSGIGGNQYDGNGGSLTIYGGSIYASGTANAAGIGGGWYTGGGSFTMYGGSVEAKAYNQYAAGIGKGRNGSQGNFTVYGTPHVYAGDTAPGSETTVAGYQSSRNSYANIIYTGHIHTWLDATCTEPQTCSECGEKVGSPLGHTWVKGDMVSEATCTQPAVYRYECSICHETKNDEFGENAAHHFVNNVCTECGTNVFVIDENGVLTAYNGNGGDVLIPEGVTSIGDFAFYDCSSLTEVTIPEGVTSIRSHTFTHCSALTKVTIPEGVTSIGMNAFFDCTALKKVTIPESITSIGESAFGACIYLVTVTISDNIKSVGENAFPGSIRTVNYPCGDDLDIIKAYFGDEVWSGITYNAFHVYSAQGTLVSAATCEHPAVYTAKCKGCDLVQGTMDVGEPLGHTFENGVCTVCGYEDTDTGAKIYTVILSSLEEPSRVLYSDTTESTNISKIINLANGTYLMSVSCEGEVTRTFPIEIIDGQLTKEVMLHAECDVNGDGVIDVNDYSIAVNLALEADTKVSKDLSRNNDYQKAVADLDGDGYVDVIDVALLERKINFIIINKNQ